MHCLLQCDVSITAVTITVPVTSLQQVTTFDIKIHIYNWIGVTIMASPQGKLKWKLHRITFSDEVVSFTKDNKGITCPYIISGFTELLLI